MSVLSDFFNGIRNIGWVRRIMSREEYEATQDSLRKLRYHQEKMKQADVYLKKTESPYTMTKSLHGGGLVEMTPPLRFPNRPNYNYGSTSSIGHTSYSNSQLLNENSYVAPVGVFGTLHSSGGAGGAGGSSVTGCSVQESSTHSSPSTCDTSSSSSDCSCPSPSVDSGGF